ncbi:MAG: sugar O-acetyltransferase [Mangrovibacterium sp.]
MMTEKEKLLAGLLADTTDRQLLEELRECKAKCHEYNQIHPDCEQERDDKLRTIIGKMGINVKIQADFFCDYGTNIEIGNDFFANHNCVMLDCGKITFGDHVFVAPNCGFYTVGHPLNALERNKWLEYAHPIVVGNNVWIGGNVVVLPGVTIGDNTVIGAGSVVTNDIPSGVLAFGNPCRVVRFIDDVSE